MLKMMATISPLAFDAAMMGVPGSEKARAMGDMIWKAGNLDDRPMAIRVDQDRPFLSVQAWALFSAYRQIHAYALGQLMILRTGVGAKLLAPPEPTIELVKAALPHYSDLLNEYGVFGAYEIVAELQDKILAVLQADIKGDGSAENMVAGAAAIIDLARTASESLRSQKGDECVR